MNTMKEALAKAGLVAYEPPTNQQQPTKPKRTVEPCSDEIGQRCAALVALIGHSRAVRLMADTLDAPYGRARRLDDINTAIANAVGRMKRKEVRALHERVPQSALEWRFNRASDLDDTMAEVHAALTDGSFAEWERAQQQASNAPKWPDPPTDAQIVEALGLRGLTPDQDTSDAYNRTAQVVQGYGNALDEWADERTERELAALGFGWSKHLELKRALEGRCFEIIAQYQSETGVPVLRDIIARYESGELTLAQAIDASKAVSPRNRDAALKALTGDDGIYALNNHLRTLPRAWRDGDGHGPVPAGVDLAELPLEVIFRLAAVMQVDAAKALLQQHCPADGVLYGGRRCQYMAYGRQHGLREVITRGELDPGDKVVTLPCNPHPDGWLELVGERYVWCSPAVYAAHRRLSNYRSGLLDVRLVIGLYGRHETERWPRLLTQAWSHKLVVGMHDSIGSHFDDLATVCAVSSQLVPEHAWLVRAGVCKSQRGKLVLTGEDRGLCAGAVVVIHGGTSSHGRHGRSGEDLMPAEGSKAAAVSAFGCSRGGGQTRTAVVAVVEKDKPLLLSNGVGYEYDGGQLYRVPGLAAGRPGEREPLLSRA